MTDCEKLRDIIAGSGLRLSYIDQCMGWSRATRIRKFTGQAEFTQTEIVRLSELLKIESPQEQQEIFLCS